MSIAQRASRTCLGFLLAMGLLMPLPAADSKGPCCFINNLHQGTCTINPVKGENCKSIQGYLNNPLSTGKSYCGSTPIRRGWIRVDCKTGKPLTDEKSAPGAAPKSSEPLREQQR